MLSKFITLGDRIELTAVGRVKLSDEEERRTYQSKVYEILTDDTL